MGELGVEELWPCRSCRIEGGVARAPRPCSKAEAALPHRPGDGASKTLRSLRSLRLNHSAAPQPTTLPVTYCNMFRALKAGNAA